MRTPREIAFRLRQELSNVFLRLIQPVSGDPGDHRRLTLPDAAGAIAHVRTTALGSDICQRADEFLKHRFSFLGESFDAGAEVSWRRDYKNGITSPPKYFRFIPYLNPEKVGDHKFVWEMNRHQHLVLLAQAQLITGDEKYLREIERQLNSWMKQNPFMCGINWCSALEVAFRATSWIWVYHLIGDRLDNGLRRRLVGEIYRSGLYLEHNLSVYFSPNTHLLGEAVALHAIGSLFPHFPQSRRWVSKGARTVSRELERQVREDGTHFEQSSYYHVYALDMFLFHYLIAKAAADHTRSDHVPKLQAMAEYLHALMGDSRTLPFVGDDDGGRFFHPYGRPEEFGRATLATCALVLEQNWAYDADDVEQQALWWLGPDALRRSGNIRPAPSQGSIVFRDAGVAVLRTDHASVIFDCGPFGRGSGGHSHSDSLGLVVRSRQADVLVDPGTYTYVGSEQDRNWFRGSAAHSVVCIDGHHQAVPAGPFRWVDKPDVTLDLASFRHGEDVVSGTCTYRGERTRGLVHRRSVVLIKSESGIQDPVLAVCDVVEGAAGFHQVEQLWHVGSAPVLVAAHHVRIGTAADLIVTGDGSVDVVNAWRSPVFGQKIPSHILRRRRETALPSVMWAVLVFGNAAEADLKITADGEALLRIGSAAIAFRQETGTGIAYRAVRVSSR